MYNIILLLLFQLVRLILQTTFFYSTFLTFYIKTAIFPQIFYLTLLWQGKGKEEYYYSAILADTPLTVLACDTYMSSSCRFNRLGLLQWDPYAVHRVVLL